MPKMTQPASKVSLDGSKWAHLEPLLPTLDVLLATWGVRLRNFTHFYEVFVNNCAFFFWEFAEIGEKSSKLPWKSWILHKNTEKVLTSGQKCAKGGQKWPSRRRKWAWMDQNGPSWSHFCLRWKLFWPLVASFLRIFTHFMRFSYAIVHFFWKLMKIQEK